MREAGGSQNCMCWARREPRSAAGQSRARPPGKGHRGRATRSHQESPGITRSRQAVPGRLRRLGAPGRVGSVPVRLPENQSWFFHQGSVLVHLPGAPSLFVCPGLGPSSFARARSRCFHQGSLPVPPGSSCQVCPVECPAPFPNLSPKAFS